MTQRFNISLFVVLLLSSCDFGNTNIDPTLPTTATLAESLPTALAQTAHNMSSIGGRVSGCIVQHYKGIDAQPESYSQYLIDERTLDDFWRTGLYGGAMKDANFLIQLANLESQPHYKGIAQIIMAINLGITTSFWGEVPYSAAFNGFDNLQPSYDLQENIYVAIQQLLAEAIQLLQQDAVANGPSEDDLIFKGNSNAWIATAKALQARYHLHLVKKKEDAAQNALTAIQSGSFLHKKDQPDFPFTTNINEANPLPLYCFERPDQMVLSDHLQELMSSQNDPRLPYYATNIEGTTAIYHIDSTQLYWGQFDAPLPLISLSEIKFIEAECQLRLGLLNEADHTFREAVIAHFKQLSIPETEYLSYLDEYIHLNPNSELAANLQLLITQKHIALFGQNPIEAWVDFRRTGFPLLSPPASANSSFNPSLVIPNRYLYPVSERTSNADHFNTAIQRQGGHFMDNRIWAFE